MSEGILAQSIGGRGGGAGGGGTGNHCIRWRNTHDFTKWFLELIYLLIMGWRVSESSMVEVS